jgi:1-phosphofructokinase family hexose kinase
MPQIITVTANTAIDNVIEVEKFSKGKVIRAKQSTLYPAGKGINVARVLATLRKDVTVLGFLGRSSKHVFGTLNKSQYISIHMTDVADRIRQNTTIVDAHYGFIAHIQSSGFQVCEADLLALEERLTEFINHDDLVIFSGSLPFGIAAHAYQNFIEKCHKVSARVILDTSGDYFRHGIKARPFMVKPNIDELETWAGKQLRHSESAIIDSAREILQLGVQIVVVSRGRDGVIVVAHQDNCVWKSSLSLDNSAVLASPIGSGDAFVAGFASGISDNGTIPESIKLGIACGAANLLVPGPGICNINDIKRLFKKVVINQM